MSVMKEAVELIGENVSRREFGWLVQRELKLTIGKGLLIVEEK